MNCKKYKLSALGYMLFFETCFKIICVKIRNNLYIYDVNCILETSLNSYTK